MRKLINMKKLIAILNEYLVLRYAISGGLSSAVDIILFSLFIKVFGFHYMISAAISVSVSFVIRFYLQKVFAFRDKNLNVHKQISMYTFFYLLCLSLTTLLLYIFIGIFHIWYVLAQIMTIGIVASISFFIYKYIIFKPIIKDTTNDINKDQ